jgi:hypothetical protein
MIDLNHILVLCDEGFIRRQLTPLIGPYARPPR